MQPKKSPRADLENRRPLFFLIGLSLSIIAAITVLQYRQEIFRPIVPDSPVEVYAEDNIPITVRDEPEKRERTKEKPAEKVDINIEDYFEPKDDDEPDEKPDDLPEDPAIDDPGLKIVDAPDDLDDAKPLEIFDLKRLAVPFECAGLSGKEEQKECLNQWMIRYIKENADYPEVAERLKLQDKVYISFVISEKGKIESVKVVKGEYDILNDEAVKVVESIPTFRAASQNGKKVKMRMTVPVNFKMY